MTWLATKTFMKKSWIFLKKYWSIPLVLVASIILFFVHRKMSIKLLDILKNSVDSYKEQIRIINYNHELEIQKRDDLIRQYNEALELIEKQYKKENNELNDKKRLEVKNIIKKHNGNTESLAKELGERYGIEYVSQ